MTMEVQVQNLSEMGKQLGDRPVWDKFGDEDQDDIEALIAQFTEKPAPSHRSVLWQTTNSEYGRFQNVPSGNNDATGSHIPTDADITRSLGLLGSSRSFRDPAASARSRAESLSQSRQGTGRDCGTGAPSTSALRLPAIAPKYMPLGPIDATTDAERRRLTTGFAKSYMTQSHAPFWGNIKSVADGAGLDATSGSQPDAQVLTIDRKDSAGDFGDDYFDDILAKYRESKPGTPANSAGPDETGY